MYTLRPATREDAPTIRWLVWRAGINPTRLDWRRFVVAVDRQGGVTGCAQIKPHAGGARELASLAVRPEWRGRGVARVLIEHWLAASQPPLYLTCRARLGPLYEKFGFRALAADEEMPAYFRRVNRAAAWIAGLLRVKDGLLVMRWDGS